MRKNTIMSNDPSPNQNQNSLALIFMIIRISGLLLIGGGLLIVFGGFEGIPMELGIGLMIMGVIELLIVPAIFNRAVSKRSQDQLIGKSRQDRGDR